MLYALYYLEHLGSVRFLGVMAAKLAVSMVVCVSALLAVAWGGRSSHPLDAFPEEIILHAPFSAFVNNSGKISADPSA